MLARFLRGIVTGERPYKVQNPNQSKKSTRTSNKMTITTPGAPFEVEGLNSGELEIFDLLEHGGENYG